MIFDSFPLLSLLILLPLLGAGVITLIPENAKTASNARAVALWTSVLTFVISLRLWTDFDLSNAGLQFTEIYTWLPELNLQFALGVDGISLLFILLSTLLTPICILSAWDAIQYRVKTFMSLFLLLEAMMIGMFAAADAFLFYVMFEGILIPMFFIIGIWGGPRRIYASFKFFLYTLLGSVLLLIALIVMTTTAGTSYLPALEQIAFPETWQFWLFWAFLASFAVKVPMWPVHTWLPDAHVEAPTAGSVILAGVLLKMGGYGLLRFAVPMTPDAMIQFADLLMGLSVVAIIYTSLVALVQSDIKKMIAYSSVAHMGYVTLGIASLTVEGTTGAMIQMVSHGFVSAALFMGIGVIYDRLHTRDINRYGGLFTIMPRYAVLMMIFIMASAGLPGTSGFVGEFMSLVGTFPVAPEWTILAASGIVLGAVYMLWFAKKIVFSAPAQKEVNGLMDVNRFELAGLVPLVVLTIFFGFYPQPLIRVIEPSIDRILVPYQNAASDQDQAALINDLDNMFSGIPEADAPTTTPEVTP